MAFDKFVDMELDDEDKLELAVCCGPEPESGKLIPQYPWGLRLSLTKSEIDKLGLDVSECQVGCYLHIKAFAVVTDIGSNSMRNSRTGEITESSRVEMQIEKIAIEDEDDEDE